MSIDLSKLDKLAKRDISEVPTRTGRAPVVSSSAKSKKKSKKKDKEKKKRRHSGRSSKNSAEPSQPTAPASTEKNTSEVPKKELTQNEVGKNDTECPTVRPLPSMPPLERSNSQGEIQEIEASLGGELEVELRDGDGDGDGEGEGGEAGCSVPESSILETGEKSMGMTEERGDDGTKGGQTDMGVGGSVRETRSRKRKCSQRWARKTVLNQRYFDDDEEGDGEVEDEDPNDLDWDGEMEDKVEVKEEEETVEMVEEGEEEESGKEEEEEEEPKSKKRRKSGKKETSLKKKKKGEGVAKDKKDKDKQKEKPKTARQEKKEYLKKLMLVEDVSSLPFCDIAARVNYEEYQEERRLAKERKAKSQTRGTSAREANAAPDAGPSQPASGVMAPQVRVVNGRIVLNDDSLEVGTHERNFDSYTRVEEGELRMVNSHSYSKWLKPKRWTKEETELFFQAVRQFGTDFTFLEGLFPGRKRTQLRAKFRREWKVNPDRMSSCLTGEKRTEDGQSEVYVRMIEELKAKRAAEPKDPPPAEPSIVEPGTTAKATQDKAKSGTKPVQGTAQEEAPPPEATEEVVGRIGDRHQNGDMDMNVYDEGFWGDDQDYYY